MGEGGGDYGFFGGGRPAFLLGHFSSEGFWYYFPIAFGIKTPLPTLILVLWSLEIAFWRVVTGRPFRSKLSLGLLLPPLIYFAVSTQSALNLGYRHLLPILPFLYAFIGVQLGAERQVTSYESLSRDVSPRNWRAGFSRAMLCGLFLWLGVGNLVIYPFYISSFNEFVGPANGYQVLVDSNVDWGQDLKRLRTWMQSENESLIKLAWFGSADPAYYGIVYDPLPGLPHHFDLWQDLPFDPLSPDPGVYAISVSMLQELHRRDEDKIAFAWFRTREPDDRVGYSILIYRVGAES